MSSFDHAEPARTTNGPPLCPECKSPSVTTMAKNPDADSYWRCERCGEVWNISRRRDGQRRGSARW